MELVNKNNKLIADLIGWKSYISEYDTFVDLPSSSGLCKGRDYLEWAQSWGNLDGNNRNEYGYHVPAEFHQSWDWIMFVVGYINELEIDTVDKSVVIDIPINSTIENIYHSIVVFINRYNEKYL